MINVLQPESPPLALPIAGSRRPLKMRPYASLSPDCDQRGKLPANKSSSFSALRMRSLHALRVGKTAQIDEAVVEIQ